MTQHFTYRGVRFSRVTDLKEDITHVSHICDTGYYYKGYGLKCQLPDDFAAAEFILQQHICPSLVIAKAAAAK